MNISLPTDDEKSRSKSRSLMALMVGWYGAHNAAWSIVGVDPDVNGALIALSGPTVGVVELPLFYIDCPTKPTQVNGRTRNRHDPDDMSVRARSLQLPRGTVAYLEQGGTRPDFAAQRSFTQGEGVGYWHGVLASEGLDVRLVEPRRWKNALGLTARDKDASREMAIGLCRELWPHLPHLQDRFRLKKASRTGGGFPHRGVRPCELGRTAWQVARTRPPLGHPRPSRSASAKEGRGVGAGAGDAVGDDRPTGGGAGHAGGVDRASGHAG